MEPRSKRLVKTAKLLFVMSFGLLMTGAMLLVLFLESVVGVSAVLLFFSVLLAALSFLYYLQYVRLQFLAIKEELRECLATRELRKHGDDVQTS